VDGECWRGVVEHVGGVGERGHGDAEHARVGGEDVDAGSGAE